MINSHSGDSELSELSPLPPAKKTERAEDMTLLLLLIMIYGLDGGECCEPKDQGSLILNNVTNKLEIQISVPSGRIITVKDTPTKLSCNSTINSCYVECSDINLFENKNFTKPEELKLCVQMENEKKTRVDFSIVDHPKSKCIVVDCLPDEIKELLNTKEHQLENPKGLRTILNIKKMCQDVIFNETIVDTYIRVEKKAIQSVANMSISEQSKSYTHEDLSMIVVKMNLGSTDNYATIPAPSILDNEEIAETRIPMKPFQNVSENKICVVTYDADQHFKLKLGSKIATSKIIRIEVPGHDFVALTDPLKIEFKLKNNYTNFSSNYTLSCQFYDEKGSNTWKSDGCSTYKISADVVGCNCDHMTPFAVLLTKLELSENQWKILSSISYVGCSLSAFFSACSVLAFMFNSNARAEVSSSLHVSLSGALFLLNMSFMLSEWAATLTETVCVFVAVMIHYSLLSCFTWMAIEALHLYLLLIRVFNIYIRHYMVKLSLIGWGVPALVVGGLLSFHNISPFYGSNEMTLSDTNATNAICWIKNPAVLYGVNLSYFTIIFLFNLGILITVSRQIFKLKHLSKKEGKMPAWKDAGTVLGLMCLLGTTWGLIFFSSGYTNLPILYLFCILNTMQGFYIFMWMCGTARRNRAQTSQSKTKSTVDISR